MYMHLHAFNDAARGALDESADTIHLEEHKLPNGIWEGACARPARAVRVHPLVDGRVRRKRVFWRPTRVAMQNYSLVELCFSIFFTLDSCRR